MGDNLLLMEVRVKKLGVITDIHGNLPALRAILALLDAEGCDEIIHTGDVVDIGPQSKECLQLLCSRKDVIMLLGNHDKDFLLNDAEHKYKSNVPAEHKQFVFSSMGEAERNIIRGFPIRLERICGGKRILFAHYAFAELKPVEEFDFTLIDHNPTAEKLDELFDGWDCDAVFFGHKHEPCDITGKRLYVDVGSVGCHPEPLATGVIIDYDDNEWSYRRVAVPYDMQAVHDDMRSIPCGEHLYNFYFLRNCPHKHD